MKKTVSLILLLILSVMLVGCKNDFEKYDPDSDLVIVETISEEEIIKILQEVAINSQNCKLYAYSQQTNGEFDIDDEVVYTGSNMYCSIDVTDMNNIMIQYESDNINIDGEYETNIYYKVDCAYYKLKRPNEDTIKYKEQSLVGVLPLMVAAHLTLRDVTLSFFINNISDFYYGKSSNGYIIVQSSEQLDDEYNNEFKIVIENGYLKYTYYEVSYHYKHRITEETVYYYDDIVVKFPKNLNEYPNF